jgi:heme-degrading monooxygenase HmoA
MADQLSSATGLFFEMRPKPGCRQAYFAHVDQLKPVLAEHDGLIWLQRYASVDDPDVILSHQLWQSEAHLAAWRRNQQHRHAQMDGIKNIFADYRIRVGQNIWNWTSGAVTNAPPADAENTKNYILTLAFASSADIAGAMANFDITCHFKSLTDPDSYLLIARCTNQTAGLADAIAKSGAGAAALFTTIRDYSLFDRAAAPLAS